LLLLLSAATCAADITGKWKADWDHPQGKLQISYTFKQDGETLTGTWQAAKSPTVEITEGKVTGDNVTFVVARSGVTFAHEGKIKDDEIQLTMKPFGEFPGSVVIAKRVSDSK
jgi:hypothetical protein